jgi:hypothetical protein
MELCVLAGVSIDDLGKQASFGGGCNRGRADGRLDWPISLAWPAHAKLGIRCTPLRGCIDKLSSDTDPLVVAARYRL